MQRVGETELGRLLRSPFAHEELAERGPFVLIDTRSIVADAAAMSTLETVPVVLAGSAPSPLVDVVVEEDDVAEELATAVAARPLASVALVLLLRGSERRSTADGLVAESAVYSVLQAGPEFERWRADHHPSGRAPDGEPAVIVQREGNELVVTLNRPTVHNAFSVAMRDQLIEALGVAAADPSIRVVIEGAGPSFCSGGDLDEMGSRPDPATAHVVRLRRSVGRILASMPERVEAHLHGACMGAGIELPAFVDKVSARPDAQIGLPEIELGLIPGAGGTVSVTRRIGRHRTALLALTGRPVDAETALSWGLVDAVV